MPTARDLRTFSDSPAPEGMSPLVAPQTFEPIVIVDHDPQWSAQFTAIAAGIHDVLGSRVLRLEHVGSTSVPGLAAKPVIDIDLTVADAGDEDGYIPALVAAGWTHARREPWWHGHRLLRWESPQVNLHVWGPDSPEPWRHAILRDHLRRDAGDCERYAAIKRQSAATATEKTETVDEYNARKQHVLREIILRALDAAGVYAAED